MLFEFFILLSLGFMGEVVLSVCAFIFLFVYSWSGLSLFLSNSLQFLLLLMVLYTFYVGVFTKLYFSKLFFLICALSYFFFLSNTFLTLYVFFEGVLLPIMFIIFLWGIQPERSLAFLSLLVYSIISALPLLYIIMSNNLMQLGTVSQMSSIFSGFLVLGFLIKVPLYFFHYWLPKAHVEAPTSGSILLAGILLKLGGWGLFCLTSSLNSLWVFWFSMLGMVLGAFMVMLQSDIKSFVAFSSICHMNFLSMSLYLKVLELKLSSIIMMISHAIIASLMFWMSGSLYHSLNTRYLGLISGISQLALSFNLVVFMFLSSNFGVPPFISFYVELVFFSGLFTFSYVLIFGGILYLMFTCYFCMFLFMSVSSSLVKPISSLFLGEELSYLVFSLLVFNPIFYLILI